MILVAPGFVFGGSTDPQLGFAFPGEGDGDGDGMGLRPFSKDIH